MNYSSLTIHEASALIANGRLSAASLVQATIERIRSLNPIVNAYITVTEDYALEKAAETDRIIRQGGPLKPLAGIPIAVKDNICTKQIRTSCSSKSLENFIPPYNGTVIDKLNEYGGILIGKTNLDEFAMGSSTETSAFGPTRNPWDTSRAPGGSSGGSAAAVAADMCLAALGSDTGGSIRQPASLCGVVGLKPTYGRVSRFGLVAFASSLDQIGPLTKDVQDAALLLNVISGLDEKDSTSAPVETPDFTKALINDVKGLKIGVPLACFCKKIDNSIENAVLQAVNLLESAGAQIREIALPMTDYSIAAYYILATSEASSNLARYDGVLYGFRKQDPNLAAMYLNTRGAGFGSEVKRRIMLGAYSLSSGYYDAYYKKAQQVRTLIVKDFARAFSEVDVIAMPASPIPAFKIGEKIQDPLTMYMLDIFTLSTNLAGLPAISIPCGFTDDSLPIGLQFIGKHFDEATLLRAAYSFEQATEWHNRKPVLP
jgi:aspartyl-tRNA(Asn)/glutamyl-tRNA(Gln) amidotransferase subunit A